MIFIGKCPYRISLLGGGSDLDWFVNEEGFGNSIGYSLDKYSYSIISKKESSSNTGMLNYSSREIYSEVSQIAHSLIRESLKYFDINKKSIILIAISFFAIQKLFFISQYSINFPYSVDHIVFGYFIDYLVDGGSFTHYLFSTHSEHYLIFPRLIMLPNLILNNFNFIKRNRKGKISSREK